MNDNSVLKEIEFKKELENLINRHCRENTSNTPDYILAEYILACLRAFDIATMTRTLWYGYKK